MEIVKKYWISFACAAVAALAFVAAVFWPLPGYYDSLKTDLAARRNAWSQADALTKKPRKLPNLSADIANPVQEPLSVFPNQTIIDTGTDATTKIQQESQRMFEIAVKMNMHKPLIPGSLPTPSQPAAYKFRDEYPRAMRRIPKDILHATMPPTPDEVGRAKEDLWKKDYESKVIDYGDGSNINDIKAQHAEASEDLAQQLAVNFARAFWVYADERDVLTWNPAIAGPSAPNPPNIWTAQMLLWLQQDIAQAIADANEPAIRAGEKAWQAYEALPEDRKKETAPPPTGILASPIKHVFKILVTTAYVTQGGQANSSPNAPLPKLPGVSTTGRVSNGLYDVIHFDLSMNVEIAKIPYILQELSRSRLITVLNLELKPIDANEAAGKGLVYGDQPIGRLDLKCEALFLRKWTEPLMPDSVKGSLGIPVQGAAAPAAAEE